MNFIELKDILSTTVVYEDFSWDSNVFKGSKKSIMKLKIIADKYRGHNIDIIENERDGYLESDSTYLREFTYKFTHFISVEKIIYPFVINDTISYEIICLLDNKEKLILSSEDININNESIEIRLNNIKVNYIKLRVKSKKNIWPKISEIKILKNIC